MTTPQFRGTRVISEDHRVVLGDSSRGGLSNRIGFGIASDSWSTVPTRPSQSINRFGGSTGIAFRMPTKVNSLSLNPRHLIAFHSPYTFLETGLRMCPAEKAGTVTPFSTEQSVLCSPVCLGIIAKYGHVSRISGERAATILCS